MSPSERRLAIEFMRAEAEQYGGGEAGRIRAREAWLLARTAGGAALGGTQGDTPEERMRNAALMGVTFAAPHRPFASRAVSVKRGGRVVDARSRE